jgi:hypothetical protein
MPAKFPAAPDWLVKLALSGAARVRGSTANGSAAIKCAVHPVGQAFAKLLDARDCGHYWSFDCPAGEHETPDAAMYPQADGTVYFKCFSGNPCSHDEIMAAVRRML